MNRPSGSKGTFKIRADNLAAFRAYLLSLLKQYKFTVDDSELSTDNMKIIATKGNKLVYYAVEQLLEFVPLSESFGWAVRVELTFYISRKDVDGNYTLLFASEPASNEINPITELLERDDPRSIMETVGEDEKCKKAFVDIARRLQQSPYCAKP